MFMTTPLMGRLTAMRHGRILVSVVLLWRPTTTGTVQGAVVQATKMALRTQVRPTDLRESWDGGDSLRFPDAFYILKYRRIHLKFSLWMRAFVTCISVYICRWRMCRFGDVHGCLARNM